MNRYFPDSDDASTLLDWYVAHGRVFPWSTKIGDLPDPYAVWVSEVMLQQTTVSAVLPRYRKWMDRFPDIGNLAQSTRDEVLREWEGLGYYSRAKNLHSASLKIREKHDNRLPRNLRELRALPGVGEYISCAVASLAYGERVATIEANSRRIVQRLTASENWNRKLEISFKVAVEENMPVENPGDFNVALMQFGQQICLPKKPKCGQCPLIRRCKATALGLQEGIPVRHRPEIIKKTTDLAIIMQGQDVWIRKRASGITAGLWSFPSISELTRPEDWIFISCLDKQLHCYTRYKDELRPKIYHRIPATTGWDDGTPTPEGRWENVAGMEHFGMPTAHRCIAENLLRYLEPVPEGSI